MTVAASWIEALTPAELDLDPYPTYARLREEAPVAWVPWAKVWFVTRWEDCARVGSERAVFRGAADHPTLERVFGPANVLTATGQRHEDLRQGIDPHLRPRQVNTYVDDLVRPIARERVAAIAGRGGADLMAEYLEPVSVRALGDLLGLGVDDGTLRRWFHDLNAGLSSIDLDPAKLAVADAATGEIEARLADSLARIAATPDDSMLSHMFHGGRPDGSARALEEVLPSLKVILLGGMQEPGHAAGSTLLGLFGRPDQLARVAADPELIPAAVTEGLRWIAPIGMVERQAGEDVRLGDAEIAAGEVIEIVLASANRDPSRFERPDEYDLDRPRQSHQAFGNGEHFCSGHYFSRQLERIALEELFAAAPGLRIDPDREPVVRGWMFRAPQELHARWDV